MEVVTQIWPAFSLSMMEDESAVVLATTGRGMNQIEAVGEIVVNMNGLAVPASDAVAKSLGERTTLLVVPADFMKRMGSA